MESTLIAEKDADRDGPVPCPSSVHACPSGRRDLLDEGDLDVLLCRAVLAPDTSLGGVPRRDVGGPRDETDDGDCRVGQCSMPGMIQRLANVRSFTAICCALAALTGTSPDLSKIHGPRATWKSLLEFIPRI